MKMQQKIQKTVPRWCWVGVLASVPMLAQAGLLVGGLFDKNGQPVAEAVIYAKPLDAAPAAASATASVTASVSETAIIDQENYLYVPYVSAIRKGTTIKFTNKDGRDHHVKSFSPAKQFEMRVPSKGEAAQTVLFDKPGEVALVCHFHDNMRGFIFVLETPYFGKTDKSGNVLLNNLPPGKYQVDAWVPYLLTPLPTQTVQVGATGSAAVNFKLDYVPKPRPAGRTPYKAPSPQSYDL